MRIIKFRDWEPEKKEMRYFGLDEYDRNEHDNYGNIMQFTGLYDKNDKEIYEGDILKFEDSIGVIYWDNGSPSNPDAKFNCTLNGRNDQPYYWLALIREVIGNIYENPELINKEQ